jgi:hypothetical protein
MCLVLPAVFFSGIARLEATTVEQQVTPLVKETILKFSRGMVSQLSPSTYHTN